MVLHLKKLLFFALLLLAASAMAQTTDTKDVQIARQKLRVGTDATKYVTSITDTINASSTHRQMPTAKAVYNYGTTLGGGGGSGHTIRDDGTDKTQRNALNFVSTATVNVIATDDSPNNETEIALNIPTDGITATEIAAGAVGSSEIATDAVDAAEIAAGAVGASELAPTTVAAGGYGSGTQVATFTVDADGRLTAAANVLITSGSNYQTLRDDNVDKAQRANANFVSTGTVVATLTDDAANTETEIALTVPTDGITATEIAANAVAASEIAADAVGSSEIATDAVGAAEIVADAVGSSELAATTVTAGSYGSATQVPTFTVDADGRLTAATNVSITTGSNYQTIRDDGTDKTQRANANFVSTSTVVATLTDDAANTETEIALTVPTDGITATEIAANAVGSSEIAADAVGSSEIATDAVGAAEIAADAVGSSEIADASITAADLNQMGAGSGEVLKWNGSAWAPATDISSGGGANYQTLRDDNVDKTQRANANFVSTGTVVATLTDDAANTETEIALTVPTDGITATEIAANSIGSSEMADNAIGAAEVTDNTLAAADLAVNVVSSLDGVTNDGGDIDIIAGSGIGVTPDDVGNTITVTNTGDTNASDDVTTSGGTTDRIMLWGGTNTATSDADFYVSNGNRINVGATTPMQITTTGLNRSGAITITPASQSDVTIQSGNTGSLVVGSGYTWDPTSGVKGAISVSSSFAPTSGTAEYSVLKATPIINQTGGASGITSGIEIDPTLTAAADWSSIRLKNASGWGIYQDNSGASNFFNGKVGIGTSTLGSNALRVNGSIRFDLGSDAQGDIYFRNASGNLEQLPAGTSGYYLQTQGPSANPQWAAITSGGTNYQTFRDDGTDKTQRANANFVSTGTVVATLTDDAANTETEIALTVPTDGITATEIAANAVAASEIAADAVGSSEIATDAVGAAEIVADAVGSSELAATTVTAGSYGSATQVPTFTVDADGRLTAASNVSITTGSNYQTLRDDGTDKTQRANANFVSTGTVVATLTDDAANTETEIALTVPTDGITATEIAANAVAASEIAADAVGSSEIATDAVGAAEIVADAVGSSELAATTVTAGSYGSATQVPTFTVDADGRLTAASNVSITTGSNYQTLRDDGTDKTQRANANFVSTGTVVATLTDDAANTETEIALTVPTDGITATELAANAVAASELAATTVTAGSYGSASAVPSYTVDADGRLTAAADVSIAIPETAVTDGSLLARVAAAETVTGGWTFQTGMNTWIDNAFRIADNVDNTKRAVFQASGISSLSTQTYDLPNSSGTIALTNDAAGGDASGTLAGLTVEKIQNRSVSATAPSSNQVLKWNGSAWSPASDATGSSLYTGSGTILDGTIATIDNSATGRFNWNNGNTLWAFNDASAQSLFYNRSGHLALDINASNTKLTYGSSGHGITVSGTQITTSDVPVGIRGNPSAGASLEVTGTSGFVVPPTMTSTQRDAVNGGSAPLGSWVYNSTTGKVNFKESAGWSEIGGGGGGGSVATDVIWDSKGDLAVGTGSNTAVKLAVGTDAQQIYADASTSTGLRWGPNTISPSQITSDQDDYAPTSWAKSQIVRISGDNGIRALTSLSATYDGDEKTIINIGSYPVYIPAEHPDGTAANRFTGFTSDYFLLPGADLKVRYDGTSSRWRLSGAQKSPVGEKALVYAFVPGSVTSGDFGEIAFTSYGSGTHTALASTTSLPAATALSTSTSATAFTLIYACKSAFTFGAFGSSAMSYRTLISIPTLSDGTETFNAQFQITNSPSSSAEIPNNTIGIEYSHGINSGKFYAYSKDNAGSRSNLDTGISVTAGKMYMLDIEVDKSRSEVRYYIDGVYIGRITTNLPNAVVCGVRNGILKTAGTTARTVNVHNFYGQALYP